jgi:NADH:ubiquinone oxidoreductase subunit K
VNPVLYERQVPHIHHNMFAIVLLTIYCDEAASAITILALFPEKKKSCSDKIGIFGK